MKFTTKIWSLLFCLTILTGCTPQQQEPIKWLTYEGPWFDIEYPSNFVVIDMGQGEGYDGVTFVNKDETCMFHVFSPQWAKKSTDEEAWQAEELLSEEVDGNVTKRVFDGNVPDNPRMYREVEIIEEYDGTVRYMFYYVHPANKDPYRTEYEQFKDSIIQYTD